MILIGSRAVKHHFPDFKRDPVDWDFALGPKHLSVPKNLVGDRIEYHVNHVICNKYSGSIDGFMHRTTRYVVAEPNHLYTLKMSHIFWPIKQEKHLYDINFLKSKGCVLNMPMFWQLFHLWTEKHGPNTRLDFEKSNDKFFDDAVERKHSHDDLHRIINPSPLYLLAKDDPEMANISEDKFAILPLDIQLDIVREEAYVLALERLLIPGHVSQRMWRVAYAKMLRAMICRLTPTWLGIFIAENYYALLKPKFNFYKLYKQQTDGKINIR